MGKLVFYRQKRQDGGTRTAVSIDDTTALHHFEAGPDPSDPALLWYVDLRCEGARLPADPEKALHWLRRQAPVIRSAFAQLAARLRAGKGADGWPLQCDVPNPPRGVRMTLVCSATRRVTLPEIAEAVREVGDHWEDVLGQLEPATPSPS